MEYIKLCDSDYRFMCVVWEHAPVNSGELVKLCQEQLGWKKSTTYTVVRKMCEKGYIANEDATVSVLIPKEQVRRDTGLSVTDAQVERVLAGKSCSMDENARKLIQHQGRLYTERLISAAMEAGFDLKALPVILMGGGAATVMRNVSERDGLCRAFLLGDDKVNAEGFERILEQMSGREAAR